MCAHDGQCSDTEKCCVSSCGYHCTPSIIPGPPGPLGSRCPEGMEYDSCGTACPLSCDQPEPRPCTRQCVPGCFCTDGKILAADRSDQCVAPNECDAEEGGNNGLSCPPGQHFESCGTACPLSCDYPEERPCIKMCVPQCVCDGETILSAEGSDTCVQPNECGNDARPCEHEREKKLSEGNGNQFVPQCTPDGLYAVVQCHTSANQCWCANPNTGIVIQGTEVQGEEPDCTAFRTGPPISVDPSLLNQCPEGKKFADGVKKCIPIEDTGIVLIDPPTYTLPAGCPGDLVYKNCGTRCEATCWQPKPEACVLICVQGCFCPDGMVRVPGTGHCVASLDECPPPPPTPVAIKPCPVLLEEVRADGILIGEFVPECTEEGKYAQIQCHGSTGYCWCVDIETGIEIEGTSIRGRPICPIDCPAGQRYMECGTACEPSCENPDPQFCTFQCMSGCFCEEGQVKNGDECIMLEDCPNVQEANCTGGKEFQACGPACEQTCSSPVDLLCIAMCQPGCFCPEGTVLLDQDSDVCVPVEDCPNPCGSNSPLVPYNCRPVCRVCNQISQTCGGCEEGCGCPDDLYLDGDKCVPQDECSTPECPAGQEFHLCGTACEATCEDPDPQICTSLCVTGCFCPPGLVKNGDECVMLQDCPNIEGDCTGGKEFQACGPSCERTCNSPVDLLCIAMCQPGCFCPEGTVPLDQDSDVCVPVEDCPNPCGSNSPLVPYNCRPVCRVCNQISQTCGGCEEGCGCPDDLYLDGDKCVPQDECSTPECPAGQEFHLCGTACEATCEDPDPQICTSQCVTGCFCPPGLVKNGDECIMLQDCPNIEGDCTGGKEFQACGPSCERTCNSPPDLLCIAMCQPGCFCPEGTVPLDQDSDVCVSIEDCPNVRISATQVTDVVLAAEVFQCPPKIGMCPFQLEDSASTCVEECSSDYDCPGERRCCPNSCGHVCHYPHFPVPQPDAHLFPPEPTPLPASGVSVPMCPAATEAAETCGAACSTNEDCASGELCCENSGCGGSVCLPSVMEQMCTLSPCPIYSEVMPGDMENKQCGSDHIFLVKIRPDGRARVLNDLKYTENPHTQSRDIIKFEMADQCTPFFETEQRYVIFANGPNTFLDVDPRRKKIILDQNVLVVKLSASVKLAISGASSRCPIA
ncbi:zonadhesin-like [Diadema setosum]|uniref:zonadhesin-like n=1 Tax=Diadema setosum TaxID=31175 RepID=UPI003B3AE57B